MACKFDLIAHVILFYCDEILIFLELFTRNNLGFFTSFDEVNFLPPILNGALSRAWNVVLFSKFHQSRSTLSSKQRVVTVIKARLNE